MQMHITDFPGVMRSFSLETHLCVELVRRAETWSTVSCNVFKYRKSIVLNSDWLLYEFISKPGDQLRRARAGWWASEAVDEDAGLGSLIANDAIPLWDSYTLDLYNTHTDKKNSNKKQFSRISKQKEKK